METDDSVKLNSKSRFVRPLLIIAILFLICSLASFLFHPLFVTTSKKAIDSAKTIEELADVAFSPKYELAKHLGVLSDILFFVAIFFFLASFLFWIRNRYLSHQNKAPK